MIPSYAQGSIEAMILITLNTNKVGRSMVVPSDKELVDSSSFSGKEVVEVAHSSSSNRAVEGSNFQGVSGFERIKWLFGVIVIALEYKGREEWAQMSYRIEVKTIYDRHYS